MRHKVKIILFSIVGLCYLTSVFELDKDECKQNFAKEQCLKFCCTKATDSKTDFHIATPQPILLISYNYHFSFAATANKVEYALSGQFIPPDKIFLRHRALLI